MCLDHHEATSWRYSMVTFSCQILDPLVGDLLFVPCYGPLPDQAHEYSKSHGLWVLDL